MALHLGNNKVSEMYLGSRKISEMYLGEHKIYPSESIALCKTVYLNQVNYTELRDPTTEYKSVGDTYSSYAVTIPGYMLISPSEISITVSSDESQNQIVFLYVPE